MLLQGLEIRGKRRLVHGFRLMQPEFTVGDRLGRFDHPDPGLETVDHHGATSELLAQRDLAAGPDLLDGFHAAPAFMPSC